MAFDLDRLPARRSATWDDYLRGVLIELGNAGVHLRGADLRIESDVPIGVGLSSSASLEIAIALAVIAIAGSQVDRTQLAKIAQTAEIEHAGTRCGIMDQFAVVFARAGSALFLDTRSLHFELLEVPESVAVVICNSMIERKLSEGAYNDRRRECEASVALLRSRVPHIAQLRDLSTEQLAIARDALPEVLYRRALHVVSENERVLAARVALVRRDLRRLGALMNESHESLRDDYEVSCTELDILVTLARGFPGVYGARMTGAGFGGCTVNLLDAACAQQFRTGIADAYRRETGIVMEVYDGTPSAGAQLIHG